MVKTTDYDQVFSAISELFGQPIELEHSHLGPRLFTFSTEDRRYNFGEIHLSQQGISNGGFVPLHLMSGPPDQSAEEMGAYAQSGQLYLQLEQIIFPGGVSDTKITKGIWEKLIGSASDLGLKGVWAKVWKGSELEGLAQELGLVHQSDLGEYCRVYQAEFN
jgi:hypothetical protein